MSWNFVLKVFVGWVGVAFVSGLIWAWFWEGINKVDDGMWYE